jgi:hypothetical protein
MDFNTVALESQAVVEKLGFGSRLSTTFLTTNCLINIWLKMSGIDKTLATTKDVILAKRRRSAGRAEPRIYYYLSNVTSKKVYYLILLY